MRELLFKGWDKEKKKMSTPFTLWEIEQDEKYNTYIPGLGKCYQEDVEIIQFLNIYDDNGKPVFENDIIETTWIRGITNGRHDYFKIDLVAQFHNTDNAVEFFDTTGKFYCGMIPFLKATTSKKIVGNIFTDPDMLIDAVKQT